MADEAVPAKALGFTPTDEQQFVFVTAPTRPMLAPEPAASEEKMEIPFNEVRKASITAVNTSKQLVAVQKEKLAAGKEAIMDAKAAAKQTVMDTLSPIKKSEAVQTLSTAKAATESVTKDALATAQEARKAADSLKNEVSSTLTGLQMSCSTCPIKSSCTLVGECNSFMNRLTNAVDGFESDMLSLFKKDFRLGLGILSSFDKCRKKLLGSNTKLQFLDSLSNAISDIGKATGSGTGVSSTASTVKSALDGMNMSGYSDSLYEKLFNLAVSASKTDDEAQVETVHTLADNLKVNLLNLIGIDEVENGDLKYTKIDSTILTQFAESNFIQDILEKAGVDEELYSITQVVSA